MKRFLILLILVGFAGGAFFSISAMNHGHGSEMNGDCPTTPLHTSVCPTGALSVIDHYISMYQAFTNGLASSSVTQVLMIALLFVVVAYTFRNYLVSIRHLFISPRNFDEKLFRPQALTRWLSLLVNSPSTI